MARATSSLVQPHSVSCGCDSSTDRQAAFVRPRREPPRARDGRLFFSVSDGGSFEVFAKNATELFAPPMGPTTFGLVEVQGKVTALRRSDGREFKRIE